MASFQSFSKEQCDLAIAYLMKREKEGELNPPLGFFLGSFFFGLYDDYKIAMEIFQSLHEPDKQVVQEIYHLVVNAPVVIPAKRVKK